MDVEINFKNNSIKLISLLFTIILASLSSTNIFAQDAASIAASVLQSSSGVAATRLSQFPVASLPTAAAPAVPKAPLQTPIPGAEKIKFVLRNVIIEGNTVYCTAELMKFANPYLNKEITVAQLQTIAQEISNKYRDAGYILTHAVLPAQSIRNGVVKIQVLEGFIDNVTISGYPGKACPLLRAYGRHIICSRPLQLKVLERFILLANDIPGEEVKAVITPSKTTPNAAELTLVSDHKLITFFSSLDNYGTTFLGPEQITNFLSANSFFFPGDRTTVLGVVTPDPRELKFIEFTHSQPLNSNGLNLLLGGNYVETHPSAILSPLFINGHTYTFYGTLSDSVIRSRSKNLNLYLTANYQTTFSTILDTPLFTDRIRCLTGGLYFDLADSWRGVNTLLLNATKGFNILGASNNPPLSRLDGRADFLKLNGEISRTQYLLPDISLYVSGIGQYGFQPLLAAQQFYFGGPVYGRAYEPAIILGDSGIAGKAELRVDSAPKILYVRNIQYYIFYDAGIVWNHLTPGIATHADATCWGGGARMAFTRIFSGNVYIGKPLIKPAPNAIATGLNVTSTRVFFQVRADLP